MGQIQFEGMKNEWAEDSADRADLKAQF